MTLRSDQDDWEARFRPPEAARETAVVEIAGGLILRRLEGGEGSIMFQLEFAGASVVLTPHELARLIQLACGLADIDHG